jgi:NADH-quinone oxidoreductase subunit J
MNGLVSEWRLIVPLVLGWLAVCGLLSGKNGLRGLGGLMGLAALGLAGVAFVPAGPDELHHVLFYVFAATAVIAAALMISDRNPVYAALWFAVTTLGVCGLFLLNSAPFLAAATVIVYAGAIVVMFVFVIMLAQQAGAASYDRQAYQPAAASAAAFLLLGCLLFTLRSWGQLDETPLASTPGPAARQKFAKPSEGLHANALSRPNDDDLGSLRNVGVSLFTDYLYAVELAGTALLIATVGAIAIAPRRTQGTL